MASFLTSRLYDADNSVNLIAFSYAALLCFVLLYTFIRHGPFVTTRSVLLGWLWVVCGPPHLWYWYSGQLSDSLFMRMTIALALMFIALVFGIELARTASPERFTAGDWVARRWRDIPVGEPYVPAGLLMLVAIVTGSFMLTVSITEQQFSNVVRFLTLSGQTDEIAIFRGTVGGSRLYIYNLLLASVAPFLSFLLLLAPARGNPQLQLLRWSFIAVVLLGKISLFNRSGAALYILQLVMVRPLLADNRIRAGTLFKGLFLVGLLVFPLFYHYLGDLPVGQFVSVYFLDRIFMAPYYGIINYFTWYPDLLPHAAGRNITIINTIWYGAVDYTPAMVRFAQEAGNYYGSFNAMFVAEAWADFGYVGVLLVSMIVGVFATFADFVIFGNGVKTREAPAILACVVYGVFVLSATAAQTALFSGGLALIPFLALFLRTAAGRIVAPRELHQG